MAIFHTIHLQSATAMSQGVDPSACYTSEIHPQHQVELHGQRQAMSLEFTKHDIYTDPNTTNQKYICLDMGLSQCLEKAKQCPT